MLEESIAKLFNQDHGCPWYHKQDSKTLASYILEEAYESVDAILNKKDSDINEELGDLLFQILLQAYLQKKSSQKGFEYILKNLKEKIERRHPHVFQNLSKPSLEDLKTQWQNIKQQEIGRKTSVEQKTKEILKSFPSTIAAKKLGDLAKTEDFDWNNTHEVLEQMTNEIKELKEALSEKNHNNIVEEIGDIYFTLAQICRHLEVDPEITALKGNQKFARRFSEVIERAKKNTHSQHPSRNDQLNDLWKLVKKTEKTL